MIHTLYDLNNNRAITFGNKEIIIRCAAFSHLPVSTIDSPLLQINTTYYKNDAKLIQRALPDELQKKILRSDHINLSTLKLFSILCV